jgi:hypothetical protein
VASLPPGRKKDTLMEVVSMAKIIETRHVETLFRFGIFCA